MKNLRCISAAVLFAALLAFALTTTALGANNTSETSMQISLGSTVTDSLSEEYKERYYKFTTETAGRVSITFSHGGLDTAKGCWQVTTTGVERLFSFTIVGNMKEYTPKSKEVCEGVYYICVKAGERFTETPYSITINFTPTVFETEPPETATVATAKPAATTAKPAATTAKPAATTAKPAATTAKTAATTAKPAATTAKPAATTAKPAPATAKPAATTAATTASAVIENTTEKETSVGPNIIIRQTTVAETTSGDSGGVHLSTLFITIHIVCALLIPLLVIILLLLRFVEKKKR